MRAFGGRAAERTPKISVTRRRRLLRDGHRSRALAAELSALSRSLRGHQSLRLARSGLLGPAGWRVGSQRSVMSSRPADHTVFGATAPATAPLTSS